MQRILRAIIHRLYGYEAGPLRHIHGRPYVFIHINKTGGTSINAALGVKGLRHETVMDVKAMIGNEAWSSAYTFSVVRNPFDKVVSQYKYRRSRDVSGIRSRNIDFNEWVLRAFVDGDPEFYNIPKFFAPQADWLRDERGLVGVDKLLRFEHLHDDFLEVARVLNINKKLPHLKKSPGKAYCEYYDSRSIEVIGDWFAQDLEYFNYAFDRE